MENLYEILGADIEFDQKQIKKSYALKLREFPPEKDEAMFKKIKDAFDILSDVKKREEYDFELKYGEKLRKLEEEINIFWNNKEYTKVIKSAKEILSIKPNLDDYLYKLVLSLENNCEFEEALMYALRLVKISDNYFYKKEVARLFYKKRDFRSAIKYYKLSYEQEPLDEGTLNSILEICEKTSDYKDLIRFFDSQINSSKSDAINLINVDAIIKISIMKNDVKILKNALEKVDLYAKRTDEDKIRLSLDLYDKALNLFENQKYLMSKMLSKKALGLYNHEEIEKLLDLSEKNYASQKLYNEFLEDRKIIPEIKEIIFLHKGPNATKDGDIIYEVKTKNLDKIKKRIVKNPTPVVTSIKALRFRYYDYYAVEEKIFERIFDVSQERKIIYDQFNDLSFDYNICYTLRKLISFYESNYKDEIDDSKRDQLFNKTLEELEEERPEEIILSVRIIKDDYFKIFEIIPDELLEIRKNAKEKMTVYYKPEEKIVTKEDLLKDVLCTIYLCTIFYMISSLSLLKELLDMLFSTLKISSSQILIVLALVLGISFYLILKNKNKTDEI